MGVGAAVNWIGLRRGVGSSFAKEIAGLDDADAAGFECVDETIGDLGVAGGSGGMIGGEELVSADEGFFRDWEDVEPDALGGECLVESEDRGDGIFFTAEGGGGGV